MTPKVFDRIYVELKREVTSGRYKPGQRLQARSLADTLRASTSPVTNAMRQLVGEDVLEYTADDGFIIPWVTERRLRDLFSWTSWLTNTGFDEAEGASVSGALPPPDLSPDDTVGSTEQLLLAMADAMQNTELTRALSNSNDRLRSTRHLEGRLFPDLVEELGTLARLWRDGQRQALRRALGRYHKRRLDAVSQLVGLSYPDRR